jgi:phosphoribosylamine--glycine ligase
VLSCTGFGGTLAAARDAAYALVSQVQLRGSQHRTDIAARAIAGDIALP